MIRRIDDQDKIFILTILLLLFILEGEREIDVHAGEEIFVAGKIQR